MKWYNGTYNQADLGKKGLLPSQLVTNDFWFHAPEWLCQTLNEISEFSIADASFLSESFQKEEKKLIDA